MRRRIVATGSVWALVVSGCGGTVSIDEPIGGVVGVASDQYRWDAHDFAPKSVSPPPRGAAWEWPSEDAFREHFARGSSRAWTLGVVIGDWVWTDARGVRRTSGPEMHLLKYRDEGPPLFSSLDAAHPCAGYCWEPVMSGDPSRLGEVELQPRGATERTFDVHIVEPSRGLVAEDFRDWVYAMTILDSGADLSHANSETAETEIPEPCDDDDELEECWEREQRRQVVRKNELAEACYEAGLVACYLAGWGDILQSWGYAGEEERPPWRVGLDHGALARGPVDLTRFFVGLVLDEDLAEPVQPTDFGGLDETRIAYAITGSGAREAISVELRRRALDPRRDPWTRARMLSVLTALHALQLTRFDHTSPVPLVRTISPHCAFSVLATPDWTSGDAYSRCTAEADDSLASQKADLLSATKLLDQEPR